MPTRTIAVAALAAALGAASLSPALAAKHANGTKKMTGACAQSSGRCISDCDQYNWCTMYTCTNRSIDARAVLAMLPAGRSLFGAALLRAKLRGLITPNVPSARSS